MDELNRRWLNGRINFYFRYKRRIVESMIEGTCLNVGCGSHLIANAVNIDEGLPNLPYADNSFDTVICSDVLEHLGPHKQAMAELLRVARKKVIITVPAYKWLYGKYDRLIGHKRRYNASDFSGFRIIYLFWFLVPILWMRKLLGLRHRPLPGAIDRFFFFLSRLHLNFGTTILAVKDKMPPVNKEGHKVSVFIPIFNEEDIIERYINTLEYIIKKIPVDYELLVVNDASTDRTARIVKAIERSGRSVRLLNYETGPTRRENLAQSFAKAKGDIIVFIDVDLVASLRFLNDLIEQVLYGYDIVTGSRYMPGSKIKRKPFRLLISVFYNNLIRLLFRTGLSDHMCGFKAFKKDVILKLVEDMGYDRSLTRGIFWDTELLVRARRRGLKIKEIPIWWMERNTSKLYFKREIKAVGYIIGFLFDQDRKAD